MGDSLVVKVAGEHMTVTVKEKGVEGKLVMSVTGNVSKKIKETEDKVEMLSILKHYSVFTIVNGDIDRLYNFVLGQSPTMARLEEDLNRQIDI